MSSRRAPSHPISRRESCTAPKYRGLTMGLACGSWRVLFGRTSFVEEKSVAVAWSGSGCRSLGREVAKNELDIPELQLCSAGSARLKRRLVQVHYGYSHVGQRGGGGDGEVATASTHIHKVRHRGRTIIPIAAARFSLGNGRGRQIRRREPRRRM